MTDAADDPVMARCQLVYLCLSRAEARADPAGLREGIALLTEATGMFADDDPVGAESAGLLGRAIVVGAGRGLPDVGLDLAIGLLTSRRPRTSRIRGSVAMTGVLAPDYVPPGLRQRVLAALAGISPRPAPLAMPTLADITSTLTGGGHDALAYLLPATADAPGAAVIARPSGEVTVLALPDLAVTACSPAGRYAAAHAAYRSGDLDDPDVARRWDAALTGGGPALRQAVFSHAASARQLGAAVARPRRPWRQAPAFIANPAHDLPWASAEARAIRAAHCRTRPSSATWPTGRCGPRIRTTCCRCCPAPGVLAPPCCTSAATAAPPAPRWIPR